MKDLSNMAGVELFMPCPAERASVAIVARALAESEEAKFLCVPVVRVVPSPEVVSEACVTAEWMPPQWEILEGGR